MTTPKLGYVVTFDLRAESRINSLIKAAMDVGLLDEKDVVERTYIFPRPPDPNSLPKPSFEVNYVV